MTLLLWLLLTLTSPAIPQCAEDAVLVGAGAFDNGRWSAFVGGPAVDDYIIRDFPGRAPVMSRPAYEAPVAPVSEAAK